MKEAGLGGEQALLAHDEATEMAEPRERAIDDPPMPSAPPLPAILMCCLPVVAASSENRPNPPTGQSISQGIAVIPAIGKQPLRSLTGSSWRAGTPDGPRVQDRFPEGDRCRGCRVQGLLPSESPRHRPKPSTSCLCRVWSCRLWTPLVR